MGLFSKLKKGLGIGTAKVELVEVPSQINRNTEEVSGKVTITAKSDQKVLSVRVAVVELSTSEFNGQQREMKKDLAFVKLDGFELKENETRNLPFSIAMVTGGKVSVELFGGTLSISGGTNLSSSNSVFSPIKYQIVAVADCEGVAIDPTDAKPLAIL
ncbi:MAG: sporulation protein [Anaerolineales bacterium]|nr:sporulation protein [Anaerolineales bacterium]